MVYITSGSGLAVEAQERSRLPEPRSHKFDTGRAEARDVMAEVAQLQRLLQAV